MTKEEILQLDRIEEYREGNQLEAKAAQGGLPDTLWDSYSAFANTDGGCILLGIKERDDHSLYVVGLKDAEKMKKDFWNNYGERAGSGLNSIFHVWEHVYHTPAEIIEEVGVDRVTVTLPNGGHEQDVKAMLELYDNPEELTFPEEEMSDKVSENKENVRQNNELSDKTKISGKLSDKLSDIVVWTASEDFVSTNMVVSQFGIDERNARRYLTRLVDLKFLSAEGENKNKKYRYRK